MTVGDIIKIHEMSVYIYIYMLTAEKLLVTTTNQYAYRLMGSYWMVVF